MSTRGAQKRAVIGPVTRVGPTWAGPQENRQGPGKNTWTDHVPWLLEKIGIFGHFWYLKKSKKTKWQPCVLWRLQ